MDHCRDVTISWWSIGVLVLLVLIFTSSTNASRVNLARGKPTEQTSTTWGGWPSYGVDGQKSPDFMAHRCTHTTELPLTWWFVDLLQEYLIGAVELTTRWYHWGRLANFTVEISTQHPSTLSGYPGLTSSPVCVYSPTAIPTGQTFYYPCAQPTRGRYIRVVKYRTHNSALTLCEFEAYEPQSYWQLEKADSNSGIASVIQTLPNTETVLRCGRFCMQHSGYRCKFIQYDAANSTCKLLKSFQTSDTDLNPGWDLYNVVG